MLRIHAENIPFPAEVVFTFPPIEVFPAFAESANTNSPTVAIPAVDPII
jgi:hypothetical protein